VIAVSGLALIFAPQAMAYVLVPLKVIEISARLAS
jgi:hypothetical protein